jgi:hypothetical protein
MDTYPLGCWLTLDPPLRDARWKQYFRLPYPTFLLLVQELAPLIQPHQSSFREDTVSTANMVGITLMRLAQKGGRLPVAELF